MFNIIHQKQDKLSAVKSSSENTSPSAEADFPYRPHYIVHSTF